MHGMFHVNTLAIGPIVWALLGIVGAVGLLAILSPSRFSALTRRSNRWVDTSKILATLDKQVDIDQYILPFSRALGIAVMVAVAVMAMLYLQVQAH